MLESSAARITAVVLAVVIAALIFFAPRTVPSNKKYHLSPQQARLELGRAYVEGGGPPMKGIKILQQVLKDDPDNNLVRWYLGTQAINTGQYRKAIGHLNILVTKLNGEELANALNALGAAHERNGNMDSALIYYRKVVEISKDSSLLKPLEKKLHINTVQINTERP